MYRSKPTNIVCSALFIGVLLSFAFYFGITALMDTRERVGGTSEEYGIFGEDFSDAFYDSESLGSFVGRCEYLIFRSVGRSDIILGDNDFLFEAGQGRNGYNYLDDYLGIGRFTGYELLQLEKCIELRRVAYQNQGVEYLLVVIPNSQTVYGEYMPPYIGAMSGGTRLDQLTAYLNDMGCDYFFNAAAPLIAAKSPYVSDQLYNNTENSLNSLGEWYVYSAVCEKLRELYGLECQPVSKDAFGRYINNNEGKTLARAAGLSAIIKNRTISLSDVAELKYTSGAYYGSLIKTTFDEKYRTEIGSSVLLEFTDEWDKIQLMPYFSNTYDTVTYKTSHQFSGFVVGKLKPDVVVQFIHEYELFDIADQNVSQTYSASLRLDTDDIVTAKPILVAQCQTGENIVCIVGQAEQGAFITVSGGAVTVSQRAAGSLFFVEADIGSSLTTTVRITARVDGKAESESVSLLLRRNGAIRGALAVVGNNSQLYSDDYTGLTLLGDSQLESVALSLEQKIIRTRELCGKNTEFIYLIVPDKLAVYGEDATPPLAAMAGTVEDYKAMIKRVRESAGMTVIDLTEEMKSHKVLGRLYYQTDTLWTDIGAYIGYFTLMSEMEAKFGTAKPYTLSNYDYSSGEDIGGGLVTRLGLDRVIISEKFVTIKPNYTSKVHFEQSSASTDINITKAFISYNSDSALPVAIVMRDEFGTEMLENMAEHFSKMYVLNEGVYSISDEQIATLKPDYIITIRCNGELS